MLKRGEKIDLLVDKSELLAEKAIVFKKSSTTLKNVMCRKNCRMSMLRFVVVIVSEHALSYCVCVFFVSSLALSMSHSVSLSLSVGTMYAHTHTQPHVHMLGACMIRTHARTHINTH